MTDKLAILSILLTCALFAACGESLQTSHAREYISAPGTEGLDLPFSAAVKTGNTIYISGNVGNIPGSLELAPGGIEAETRQTLENIKATLAAAGATMDDIVKCSVFMADMTEWPAMNDVYRQFFTRPPARSALGANGLALGAKVEIECLAVVGD